MKHRLHILAFILTAMVLTALAGVSHTRALGDAVSDKDRTYRDFIFAPVLPAEGPSALRLRLASPLPREKIRAVTIHLKSGDGWHGADLGAFTDVFCDGLPVRIPLSTFAPEGSPGPFTKADAIRISAWKNADFAEPVELAEATFDAQARIAVISPTDRTAPGAAALGTSLAGRCAKLLGKSGLEYDFVADDCGALIVKRVERPVRAYDLALLPYSPSLPAEELGRLKSFVEAGGKLIVFFNGDKTLGSLLGVEPGPWRSTGTRAYTAIDASSIFGHARRIPHFTEGVIAPRPIPGGDARKAATWLAAFDRPVASPAIALSPSGAWFAHVPPRAYPAAVDLVYALATNLVPTLAVNPTPDTRHPTPETKLSTCLKGKTCAAWVNTAELPVEGFERLRELGLDTLYMHWQTAHEHKRPFTEGGTARKLDSIEDLAAAGRKAGLKTHA